MKLSTVEELVKLIQGSTISELTWNEGDSQLTIKQGGTAPIAAPQIIQQPAATSAPAAPAVAAESAPASKGHEMKSPMVGTFYEASNPDAAPYVKVGDRVKKGQVLCIIEAMKLMNEIESDATGVVEEICVENTAPVEFGTVLFRINTNA